MKNDTKRPDQIDLNRFNGIVFQDNQKNESAQTALLQAQDQKRRKIEESLKKMATENRVDNQERTQLLHMRQRWSLLFGVIVFTILIFEIMLTLLVGADWLTFEDEWFVRLIIMGGFLQILSMPFTLTRFLFNTDSSLSRGRVRTTAFQESHLPN